MKFGRFEGDSQEFKDVCENLGYDPKIFFEVKSHKINTWALVGAIVAYVIVNIFLFKTLSTDDWYTALFITAIVLWGVICVLVHLKFAEKIATTLTVVTGLAVICYAVKISTPKDTIKELNKKVDAIMK
ncbi:hypothetical protein SAMN06265348_101588 [Pedobacter westerhofensis]|uniref:Uncharacterized protein n=1 Tax=Pedobacter westerhofensis TaxID=425512 RepID=A0A521B197_9SPHI|nr:hypothetical protein [Pedobacter westerhofensis]SMO40550.1 hypothetical protein SAMN06265348_101588 [Pedobacter westerhofensis]